MSVISEKPLFQRMLKTAAVGVLAAATLVGCGGDDDDDDEVEQETAMVRVLHGSADSPAVNVYLNDSIVIEALEFTEGSDILSINAGTATVEVRGILPDGSEATVIGPVDLDFAEDSMTDIIATNALASIAPIVRAQDEVEDVEGVRVRVNHFAPAAPEVNVYVTAPDAELASSAPLGSFEFEGELGPVEVPAGDYRIRVTTQDDTLVFDSGTVALAEGKDLLINAYPNTASGASPIQLAVQDEGAESIIFDQSAGADLRVIHNSADTPAVDVWVNDFAVKLFDSAPFKGVTDYANAAAGTYSIQVAAEDTQTAAINVDALTLENGKTYTVMAVGSLGDSTLEALVFEDDTRAISTEARVRIFHGSTVAGEVDIYVTAQGASLDSSTPAFTAVPFKAETGYVALAAGDYDVTVTPTGTTTAAIGPVSLTLEAGKIYTAIARDDDGSGLGLITADDLAN